MLNLEPPPTRFDLRFNVAGFPVRIHPMFWLITAVLGFSSHDTDPINLVIWIAVVFLSILVHELGHALTIRSYGWISRITLHHFGGLASMESPASYLPEHSDDLNAKAKIRISAAGPGAGFLLAAVVIGVLFLCPIHFQFVTSKVTGIWWRHDLQPTQLIEKYHDKLISEGGDPKSDAYRRRIGDFVEDSRFIRNSRLSRVIDALLYVNIFWGLLNLLPVFPLDGGQITLALFSRKNPRAGLEKALLLSVIVAGIAAGIGLLHFVFDDPLLGIFIGLMFGLLAFSNYRSLQQVRATGGMDGYGEGEGGVDPDDWWKR